VTTGTGWLVLIVISGKVNGFSVIGMPFMLVTCSDGDVTGEFCTRGNVRETGTRGAEA
jgi:hypothetical protein